MHVPPSRALAITWNHVIEMETLKFKKYEHVKIEKVEQLFRDMLQRQREITSKDARIKLSPNAAGDARRAQRRNGLRAIKEGGTGAVPTMH